MRDCEFDRSRCDEKRRRIRHTTLHILVTRCAIPSVKSMHKRERPQSKRNALQLQKTIRILSMSNANKNEIAMSN